MSFSSSSGGVCLAVHTPKAGLRRGPRITHSYDLRAGAEYPYGTPTNAVSVAIAYHVGNDPIWRPRAWFTRRDRFALAEASVFAVTSRGTVATEPRSGGRSGVSRPMCSCMVADMALDVVLAGGGLRFSGF